MSSNTFHSGKGVSPYFVDCSTNPMDLRPATDMIIARITQILSETDKDTPIVVLLGEDHETVSQIELQHLVTARLHHIGEKFTFNVESPYNFIEEIASKGMESPFPDYLQYRTNAYDHEGKATLAAQMGYSQTSRTPCANNNLFAFCYKNEIPFQYNDISQCGDFPDINDPHNKEFTNKKNDPKASFCLWGANVVAMRNRSLVERALSHAQDVGARLILQKTGRDHIFGNSTDKLLYEDSLCALFKNEGAQILSVLPVIEEDNYGINVAPKEARVDIEKSVIISALDTTSFSNVENVLHSAFFASTEEPKELKHIRKIHANSGDEITITNVDADRTFYQEKARAHIDELIARAEKDVPPPDTLDY